MAKLSVQKTLANAQLYIKRGEFQIAHERYADVLKFYPNNITAKKGLKTLRNITGYSLYEVPPERIIDQILSSVAQKEYEVAAQQAENLIKSYPSSVDLWNILGASYAQLRKFDQAITAFKKIINLRPKQASAHYNLGNVFKDQGNLETALKAYTRALDLKPNYDAAYNNLMLVVDSLALPHNAKLEEITQNYDHANKIKAKAADAKFEIGHDLQKQGKLVEALSSYRDALSLWPAMGRTHNNIGIILSEQGKLETAIQSYKIALKLQPDFAEIYHNMSTTLRSCYRFAEAMDACKKSLELKPDYTDALSQMGNLLTDQGEYQKAIQIFKKALAINPHDEECLHNMSHTMLASKDFANGFKQSESRWKTEQQKDQFLKSDKPIWTGDEGQRVLIWAEQGIGDEIMFSSIIPDITKVSSKIIIQCDRRLIPLFRRSFHTDIDYYPKGTIVPEEQYDFHIPVGSLPTFFRKDIRSFDRGTLGYLHHDKDKTEKIKEELGVNYGTNLIGISWNTKSPLRGALNRNIKLANLARVLDRSDTKLLSLQYGDHTLEIQSLKKDYGIDVLQYHDVDNKEDIDGLASLMAACNYIVTTTNVTVHLAGALGLNVTALLPYAHRWIWGNGSEILWYNTVRPIKQSTPLSWDNVFNELSLRKTNRGFPNE